MMSAIPEVTLPSYDELLRRLIELPSISSALSAWDQSNMKVITLLEAWFNRLGFKTEVLEVPGCTGKANLFASIGQGSKGLVLAGHTDTVPFDSNKWKHDPFKMKYESEKFYGLGSCDMKGFFPIIVEALRMLEGAELDQPLMVLATADEESSMSGARAISSNANIQARAAVIGEPTSLRPIRMHKGIMMESIRVNGKSGHSSNPALGRNAMEDMYVVIGELLAYRKRLQSSYQNEFFEVGYPTMNLGHVHGGDSPNRICGHCELSFDLRILPGMHSEAIRKELAQCLQSCIEQHQLDLTFEPLIDYVDPFETPINSELVKLSERFTGQTAGAVAFATEAPFFSQMGMETVVMGAGSIDQAHQPNEFLASNQVKPMAQTLKALIEHYCVIGENNGI